MPRSIKRYQMGVDIGTSSAAFYAFELNEQGRPEKHLFHDLMIFGEPVEGKDSKLKNVTRRESRGRRRRIERRSNRLKKIGHLAMMCGITKESTEKSFQEIVEDNSGRYQLSGNDRLWEERARAAKERVPLPVLFSIISRMAKTRGVSFDVSNIENSSDSEYKDQLCAATEWILKNPKLTIGEILVKKKISGELRSLTNRTEKKSEGKNKKKTLNEFPFIFHRDHYKKELRAILEVQAKFHPILNEEIFSKFSQEEQEQIKSGKRNYFWGESPRTVKDALFLVCFYQYPRKGYEKTIGLCSLIPEVEGRPQRRLAAFHPTAEKFLSLKTAEDLKWRSRGQELPLSKEQKEIYRKMYLFPELFELAPKSGKVSVDKYYEILENHGHPRPNAFVLSLDNVRSRSLAVSSTKRVLENLGAIKKYEDLSENLKSKFIEFWSNVASGVDSWETSGMSKECEERFGDDAEKISLIFKEIVEKNGKVPDFKSLGLRDHRISYGEAACKKLFELMQENGCQEHEAKAVLFPNLRDLEKVNPDNLTRSALRKAIPDVVAPGQSSESNSVIEVLNPIVRRSVQEVRKRLIERVREYGPPEKVIVEMSRDAKTSKKDKEEISKHQKKTDKISTAARAKLEEIGLPINSKNIRRIILLWEQGGVCPYTGREITEKDAVNGQSVHEEHIVPKDKIGRANARRFIVLAKASFNLEKGNSRTLYEFFEKRGEGKQYTEMKSRIESKKKNFSAPLETAFFKNIYSKKCELILRKTEYGSEIGDEEFIERQLRETSYVGRSVLKIFQSVSNDVFGSRGNLTAVMRSPKILGIDSVIEESRVKKGGIPSQAKNSTNQKKKIKKLEDEMAEILSNGAAEDSQEIKYIKTKIQKIISSAGFFHSRKPDGSESFNKRVDHRHHLIDACAIALSDRKFCKYLLESEIAAITKREKVDFESIKKLVPKGVRDDISKIIDNFISIPKRDRLVSGAFFKDNPVKKEKNDKTLEILTTDHSGKSHSKHLVQDTYACAILNKNKEDCRLVTLVEYTKERKKIRSMKNVIYKNDVLKELKTGRYFKVAQFTAKNEVKIIDPNLAIPYDEFDSSYGKNENNKKTSFHVVFKNFEIINCSHIRRKKEIKTNRDEIEKSYEEQPKTQMELSFGP